MYPSSASGGPSSSNTMKYGIASIPSAPYFGFSVIFLCRHSVSASPRCQRRRCRDRTFSVSGASVQHTGSGTNCTR